MPSLSLPRFWSNAPDLGASATAAAQTPSSSTSDLRGRASPSASMREVAVDQRFPSPFRHRVDAFIRRPLGALLTTSLPLGLMTLFPQIPIAGKLALGILPAAFIYASHTTQTIPADQKEERKGYVKILKEEIFENLSKLEENINDPNKGVPPMERGRLLSQINDIKRETSNEAERAASDVRKGVSKEIYDNLLNLLAQANQLSESFSRQYERV